MSRFFKSAAFPILIVVVLAFLAVKLVNPSQSNKRSHSYQTLVSEEIPKGEVELARVQEQGQGARSQAQGQRKLRSGLRRTGHA